MSARFASSGLADIDRHELFFGVFLVASLNGVVGHLVRATEEGGWLGAAMNLFGVSAIVWLALAAGLTILWQDQRHTPLRNGDLAVACVVLAAAVFPAPALSKIALTGAALWATFTSAPGAALRRAAIIFLAITGALLWGRLVLAMFSGPLLGADALLVAILLGAQQSGNTLWYGEITDGIVVAAGCSSMRGLSLALVFWATVNQFFEVRFGWRAAAYCLAALAATIGINVLRIGAMLRWPERFDDIHVGWGYHLSVWVTLLLVVAICMWGARREAFARR